MKSVYALASLAVMISTDAAGAYVMPLSAGEFSAVELTRASARWHCVKTGPAGRRVAAPCADGRASGRRGSVRALCAEPRRVSASQLEGRSGCLKTLG
jgi:hypothetical protein